MKETAKKRFFSDTLSLSLSLYFENGISFILPLIIVHFISPSEYGLLALTTSIASLALLFLEIQLSTLLVKLIGDALADKKPSALWPLMKYALLYSFSTRIILFVVFYWGTPLFASWLPGGKQISNYLVLWSFSFLSLVGGNVLDGFLEGLRAFRWLSINNVIKNALRFVLTLLFLHRGIAGILFAWILANLISLIVRAITTGFVLKKKGYIGGGDSAYWHGKWPFVRSLVVQDWFTTTLKGVWSQIDVILLGYLAPLQTVSFYRIGKSLSQAFLVLSVPFSSVMYPQLVKAWAEKKKDKVIELFKEYYRKATPLVGVIAILAVILAPLFFRKIFPPEYEGGAVIFQILVWGAVPVALTSWSRSYFFTIGKPLYSTATQLIRVIGLCGLGYLLTQTFVETGMAFALLISNLLATLWIVVMALKEYKIWKGGALANKT